ncbi:hypothetical protein ANO11243_077690 [Dothideomycetidae sp. 11243]|nr:hypothetical protein ANO11243_077690 [fungal sp. No.11243]
MTSKVVPDNHGMVVTFAAAALAACDKRTICAVERAMGWQGKGRADSDQTRDLSTSQDLVAQRCGEQTQQTAQPAARPSLCAAACVCAWCCARLVTRRRTNEQMSDAHDPKKPDHDVARSPTFAAFPAIRSAVCHSVVHPASCCAGPWLRSALSGFVGLSSLLQACDGA